MRPAFVVSLNSLVSFLRFEVAASPLETQTQVNGLPDSIRRSQFATE